MPQSVSAPIYHEVADELGVFPMAMKERSHAQFMREHNQEQWLRMQLTADVIQPPAKKAASKRPTPKKGR